MHMLGDRCLDALVGHQEYYATYSITLKELMDAELVDPANWEFDWPTERKTRVLGKFVARYLYREIGITPPDRWEHETKRKMAEVMAKYEPIYSAMESGQAITDTAGYIERHKEIYSDFPQSMLDGRNADYAHDGRSYQTERVGRGSLLEQVGTMQEIGYKDIDTMFLDELDSCFSCLLTVSMNLY